MAENEDQRAVRTEFDDLVNMTRRELEDWLGTDDSKAAGQKDGGGESTGHRSGRRIVDILATKKDDLRETDYEHMQKVNGYIRRHQAQRPLGDVEDSRWRHSLMNWGHDPLK